MKSKGIIGLVNSTFTRVLALGLKYLTVMWVKRNVRLASCLPKHALLREPPNLRLSENLKDYDFELLTESSDSDSPSSADITTSYLMENLQGVQGEVLLSVNPRRSCPLAPSDFEE
ncbi:expressed protein [Echinococcus multilocularis]|uniref:Expressed protein n=1 Tax=Echinococcus multilocularis TaxID=6211 RepID=A0A068Y7W4_ECHMU|nr:expressed protein [Echinococcus multilocularis]